MTEFVSSNSWKNSSLICKNLRFIHLCGYTKIVSVSRFLKTFFSSSLPEAQKSSKLWNFIQMTSLNKRKIQLYIYKICIKPVFDSPTIYGVFFPVASSFDSTYIIIYSENMAFLRQKIESFEYQWSKSAPKCAMIAM